MTHSKRGAPPVRRGNPPVPTEKINELIALYNAGQWELLETKTSSLTVRHPAHPIGWSILGKTRIQLAKWPQALEALSRLLKIAPGNADGHNDLGYVLEKLDKKSLAEASYQKAIQCDPRCAPAYNNLGIFFASQGRLEEAKAHYLQSLAIAPDSATGHNNLGTVLRDMGDLQAALEHYQRAFERDPGYFEACVNLGITFADIHEWEQAQSFLRKALALRPNSDIVLFHLGNLLARLAINDAEAIACLERAIALNPGAANAYIALGNILQRGDQVEKCWPLFRRARELQPLITWVAKQEKADFSVVLLDTPIAGSTPLDYLVGRAPYDRHFYCLIPDTPSDIALLRAKGHVVINMIADADNGSTMLPQALDVVEQLGLPVVNHPRRIMHSDRESIARRLTDIPLCHIPKTLRLAGPVLAGAAENHILDGLCMPLLVRLAGKHGGDDFEKMDDILEIANFAKKYPADAVCYVTEYADYRSADGYFRKYRLISIGGELLPYHLAIHDDWKVHHFRTDMAHQAWMRAEEEAFLKNPSQVFDAPHWAALQAIAAATHLDYCGIDCALNRTGEIVVFEANATMLVHDEKDATFAYKNPYIANIKEAFDALLARMAKPATG